MSRKSTEKKDTATEKAVAKAKEYEEMLKRLQAEFENFKKRNSREREEFAKIANCQVIMKILPFLDAFESAVRSEKIEKVGLVALHKQFLDLMKTEGLVPMEPLGKQFDPYVHEALLKDCNKNVPDNTITEVIQTGYLLGGKVLRPAKVKINKVIK